MTTTTNVLFVLGAVALLTGLGMAAFAYQDQAQNEEQPLSDDNEDRSDRNEQLMLVGWVTAAIGAVLVVVGGVSTVASRN